MKQREAAVSCDKALGDRQPDWIDEKDGEEGKKPSHYESRGDVPPLHRSSVIRKLHSLAFSRYPTKSPSPFFAMVSGQGSDTWKLPVGKEEEEVGNTHSTIPVQVCGTVTRTRTPTANEGKDIRDGDDSITRNIT